MSAEDISELRAEIKAIDARLTALEGGSTNDHVRAQLRLIRAENDKRDRDLALMRAEFAMFRSQLDGFGSQLDRFGSKLDVIISVLSTHSDNFYQINEKLLLLHRQREGEA